MWKRQAIRSTGLHQWLRREGCSKSARCATSRAAPTSQSWLYLAQLDPIRCSRVNWWRTWALCRGRCGWHLDLIKLSIQEAMLWSPYCRKRCTSHRRWSSRWTQHWRQTRSGASSSQDSYRRSTVSSHYSSSSSSVRGEESGAKGT